MKQFREDEAAYLAVSWGSLAVFGAILFAVEGWTPLIFGSFVVFRVWWVWYYSTKLRDRI